MTAGGIIALSGGVGGAKLVLGLSHLVDGDDDRSELRPGDRAHASWEPAAAYAVPQAETPSDDRPILEPQGA